MNCDQRQPGCSMFSSLFFFFQAEDGIRDVAVTGVQTCALPICHRARAHPRCPDSDLGRTDDGSGRGERSEGARSVGSADGWQNLSHDHSRSPVGGGRRSGVGAGGRPDHRARKTRRTGDPERTLPRPLRTRPPATALECFQLTSEPKTMRKQELPADVCLETFPEDPDFPQLKIAGDPGRMLEVFRKHLKPVSENQCHIQHCIPFRFRCRQSTSRCVLQYTLRLVEPVTGRQWDQWVTGVVYARDGEAERLWRQLQAEDPRREIPQSWLTFEPVDFIPELRMLVEVFPYDQRLRNLALVLGRAAGDLQPLLLARLDPGRWHAAEHAMEPTRYRTELGAALKFTMQAREELTARSETL